MIPLFLKEIASFLTSLIGYIVLVVFLLIMGLFLWVFTGESNILDSGYADLSGLFYIAPWVFLFLIPAITMRMISEERRTGTLEWLLTKPITELKIVLAKWMAGVVLVLIALLPTLVYVYTMIQLGNPPGNLDFGGTWGSYIGLVLLAATFVSIGIFASSLTNNQIVAFILATFLSFFLFIGFESIASFQLFGSLDSLLINLGMNAHFISLSRGVIDTRDVVYFLTVMLIFLLSTEYVLKGRL
jgi:ABC-2 type transport system permease protein